MFVRELFLPLDLEVQYQVISIVGQLVLDVVDGVLEIQAEQNRSNNATDDLPPTLPHELAKIHESAFGEILSVHINQLRQCWTEESIADIERQYNKLVFTYQNESALKLALDKCDHNTSLEARWQVVEGRFDVLRDFCGGIFANTATVESDFSVLG